ncbi:MAG: hypothetical protein HGA19_01250 [Oscillochloris sp.]|nr:hypothetical protein [Oscillochloris sp.]
MATSKIPVPAATPEGASITSTSIADAGAGLIRLWVAAITLPLTIANTFGAGFTRLITSVTAALDGTVPAQGNNEIVKATNDLINATTGLYLSVLKAAIGSLESATRAVNAAVAETTQPPRK